MTRLWPPGFSAPVSETIVTVPLAHDSETACLPGEHGAWTLVDSGTSALIVALADALHQASATAKPEVLLPAYCCPQVLSAIKYVGAIPVLIDLDSNSPRMNFDAVRAAQTPRTVAAVAINFLGIPERIGALREVLPDATRLIYDCCQSYPTLTDLHVADYVVMSFGRGKPVSLLHGGAVHCAQGIASQVSDSIGGTDSMSSARFRARVLAYDIARSSRVFPWLVRAGLADTTHYTPASAPRRMSDKAVALLGANVACYDRRNHFAQDRVRDILRQTRAVTDLATRCCQGVQPRLLRYPVLCSGRNARNALERQLRARGVGASAFYRESIPTLAADELGHAADAVPMAQQFAESLLTLPIHSGISNRQLDAMEQVLRSTAESLLNDRDSHLTA